MLLNSLKDKDEVLRFINDMDSYYTQLEKDIDTDEDYYTLRIKQWLDLPDEYVDEGTVLPTARSVVDTATDHIAPQFRDIIVPKRRDTRPAIEQARKIRLFYEALLNYFERGASVSPFRDAAKHLALHGMMVFKIQYDRRRRPNTPTQGEFEENADFKERMEDWDLKRTYTMPLILNVVHPHDVIVDPFNDPPEWVAERGQIMVGQAENDFPAYKNTLRSGRTALVEKIEIHDDQHRAVYINGESALGKSGNGIVKTIAGIHPYVVVASGLGHKSVKYKAEYKYVGLLRFIKRVLLSESRQYSIADIVMKHGAWPQRFVTGPNTDQIDGETFQVKHGTVKVLPPDSKIETITPELPDHMVYQMLSLSSNIIAENAAPRSLGGNREPGTSSGYDNQLNLSQAKIRYRPLADAMESALSQLCQKAGIIVERQMEGSISISAGAEHDEFIDISSSVFKNHRAVRVRINVLEPEDEIRKHTDIAAMVAARLKSRKAGIKEVDPTKDPTLVMEEIAADDTASALAPLISAAIAQDVAQRLNLEEQVLALLESQNTDEVPRSDRNAGEGDEVPRQGDVRDQAARRNQARRVGA